MTLRDKIKAIAKAKKIPLYRIEKEVGIANGSISKWTTSSPSVEKVKKVADVLGVPVEKLISD